jgi:SAM-dependent methyltransferase
MTYPERIIPDETEGGVLALHLKRYAFAAPFCTGRDVLDAACGVGYGSAYLADVAQTVTAVDVSEDAVGYARRRYGGATISFETMDVHRLDLPADSIDTVCAFEMIEHVERPEDVLREFGRVLRPDGTLVISTPRAARSTAAPDNPHHRQEWARDDFEALLRGHYEDVEVYAQRRLQTGAHRLAQRLDVAGLRRRFRFLRRASRALGTPALEDLTLDDVVIDQRSFADATEIVAVCRRPRA